MREIIFRGKSKNDGQWVYGDLSRKPCNGGMCYTIETLLGSIYLVETESVGQYTGLKDKNGKEIYEGDIVNFTNEIDEIFNEEIGVVVFEQAECNFCIQRTVINPENYPVPKTIRTIYLIDNAQYNATYEVIGNIYDNTDLLK